MDDSTKAAEKHGYSKGYAAGRKRVYRAITAEQRERRETAFWQRAFLSVLPAAMNSHGWTFGEKPITSTDDRVTLASRWADSALKTAKREGRVP